MKLKNIAKSNRISIIADCLQRLNNVAKYKTRDGEISHELDTVIYDLRDIYTKEFSEMIDNELEDFKR